jgi:hypothetical protein
MAREGSLICVDKRTLRFLKGAYPTLREDSQRVAVRKCAFLGLIRIAGILRATLGPSFVNQVEGCFRGATKAAEACRGNDLPNACLAGLRTQT